MSWENPEDCEIFGNITGFELCRIGLVNLWNNITNMSRICRGLPSEYRMFKESAPAYHDVRFSIQVTQENNILGKTDYTSSKTEQTGSCY